MTTAARLAYGNTRVRAMKSRLRGPPEAARRRLDRRRGRARGGDGGSLFGELVAAYATVRASCPGTEGVVTALVGLHEIENLKVAWRALSGSVPADRWIPLWRPLGPLGSLDPEIFREETVESAAARLPPPWKTLWEEALARRQDPASVEIGWDRRSSRELVRAARGLRDGDSREILLALVRERDLQIVRRGAAFYGLDPPATAASTALLSDELGEAGVADLCGWRGTAPLDRRIARGLGLRGDPPTDWPALELRLRRRRRDLCRRAFRRGPFSTAPAVALLVLKEEERRSVVALDAYSAAGVAPARALDLALAAGPMEA